MPSPDTLATIALVAGILLAVLAICRTEPGGLMRALGGEHTGRRVRPAGTPRPAHARPLVRHAAPSGTGGGPLPISDPNATIPDPFVARTA